MSVAIAEQIFQEVLKKGNPHVLEYRLRIGARVPSSLCGEICFRASNARRKT